jgi:hypothetical protein
MPNFGTNKKPSVQKVSKHEHGPGMSFWVGPKKGPADHTRLYEPMKAKHRPGKGKPVGKSESGGQVAI